jgi:DinB superfamily
MSAELVTRVSARLAASAGAIEALVATVDPDLARFRPAPGKWSILEVLGHLVDEERLDFRARIELTLADPGAPWPAIEPDRWVREQDFNAREIPTLLAAFLEERRRSLAWLAGLHSADWGRSHHHPPMGDLTAASLLCAWAAHDVLHLRQISGVLYAYLSLATTPSRVDYAGTW